MITDQTSRAFEASAKTLEALKTALYLAFKLFEKHHEQPPPTPDNLAVHVPCQVLNHEAPRKGSAYNWAYSVHGAVWRHEL
jgi:hypothetical protein